MTDALCVQQRVLAFGGQADRVPDPVKELNAQLRLQLLDLDGDGRLGIAQLFTGAGKAAGFRYLDECIQTFQLHMDSLNQKFQCSA